MMPKEAKRKRAKSVSGSEMAMAIRAMIRTIPRGRVATYGEIAEAAGYPRYHRQVAQVLRKWGDALPWHRVLGSGGIIKCKRDAGLEQRMRLEMEGVRFRGSRVNVAMHKYTFPGAPIQRGLAKAAGSDRPARTRRP